MIRGFICSMTLFAGAALSLAAGADNPSQVEVLRCVRELKQIVPEADSLLNQVHDLVLAPARVRSRDGADQVWLMIGNERGVYAFYIKPLRLNRLHFEMPDPDPRRPARDLFVDYLHSDVFGSRLLSLSYNVPPVGRAVSDYTNGVPVAWSVDQLRRQFIQLVAAEVDNLQRLNSRGRLANHQLLAGNLSLCRRLGDADTKLARWLNAQIGALEMLTPPGLAGAGRMPASLPGQ